jgi:hypothetical protein
MGRGASRGARQDQAEIDRNFAKANVSGCLDQVAIAATAALKRRLPA